MSKLDAAATLIDATDPVERAYDLARSGNYTGVVDIERTLKRQGFEGVSAHLGSPILRRELASLCRAARMRIGG